MSTKSLPKCLLITPARNEAGNIEKTIRSMVAQNVRPTKWMIVNDGSTDETPEIIDKYTSQHSWIERLDMPIRRERSFAAKANSFNTACKAAGWLHYDVVGNIDADISFEPDFLEFLLSKFSEDPALGVAGTPFLEEGGYDSATDSFEGENYVSGQCQLFRQKCLEEVGGYFPNKAGGVDWIAVMTARMKGWKARSFREKRFFHHRVLGTAERGPLAALYSYGQKDYYLGGSVVWEMFRVTYRLIKPPLLFGGLALAAGFTSAAVSRLPRAVSDDLMKFHQREQMAKLRAILSTVCRFKKVDSFSVLKDQTPAKSRS
jgi:glycosyltransferase involved in cell wall biosynthesis